MKKKINIKKKIPYVNLPAQYKKEKKELLPIIDKVLSSGSYILGTQVEELENTIAQFVGVKYCTTLNSGTDSLLLGLHGIGVGSGDEVITQPNSFIASASTIAHLGAKPVFVDVLEDQSIDFNQIEKKINNRTKAIMPVHLTGRVGEFDEIKKIAKKYSLSIIEDAAQSFGSKYKNQQSGSLGDVGCFSTHPLKNFNAMGDGGFLTTNSKKIYNKSKLYRNHGLETRDSCLFWGSVSRLDEIQAAILNFRFKNFDNLIKIRIKNAKIYHDLLDKDKVFIPQMREHATDTFHTFVIQTENRQDLVKYLKYEGISTSIHYPTPIHLQPAAKYLNYSPGDFPITESQSKKILTLPINQELTDKDIKYICSKVNHFFRK